TFGGTPEHLSVHIVAPSPLFSVTIPYRGALARDRLNGSSYKTLDHSRRGGAVIAPARVTGFLLNRRPYTGHPPPSDLYESSMLLPRSPCLTHIIITRGHNSVLGAITAPGATLTHGSATGASRNAPRSTKPLVPALQSQWSMMHASTMTPSYATLSRSCLLAMALSVVAAGWEHPNVTNDKNSVQPFFCVNGSADEGLDILIYPRMGHRGDNLSRRLDWRSHRIISLGFPLSTIGISPGAVWANEARGYHRNRDPKETWAPITWLTLAIHPHIRITKGWQGKKPAIVAPSGFLTTRIRHLGVNISGKGLHSHGWLVQ
uniref:Cytochrome c heme attachment protein n=1 Tax=Megaloselaginella exaltata TaxID=3140882 RepID=A0A7T8G031_9TRAC|nr:cytochrome c heme attachment protein [Selaginella exaltata]